MFIPYPYSLILDQPNLHPRSTKSSSPSAVSDPGASSTKPATGFGSCPSKATTLSSKVFSSALSSVSCFEIMMFCFSKIHSNIDNFETGPLLLANKSGRDFPCPPCHWRVPPLSHSLSAAAARLGSCLAAEKCTPLQPPCWYDGLEELIGPKYQLKHRW